MREGVSCMTNDIELLIKELILKVESSQGLIDELRLQVRELHSKLDSQEKLLKDSEHMQEKLEHYFLLSNKQVELIKVGEDLQQRAISLLSRMAR